MAVTVTLNVYICLQRGGELKNLSLDTYVLNG